MSNLDQKVLLQVTRKVGRKVWEQVEKHEFMAREGDRSWHQVGPQVVGRVLGRFFEEINNR